MEAITLFNSILALATLIAGGGWYINRKAKKKAEDANAKLQEAFAENQTLDNSDKSLNLYERLQKLLVDQTQQLSKGINGHRHIDLEKRVKSVQNEVAVIKTEITKINTKCLSNHKRKIIKPKKTTDEKTV